MSGEERTSVWHRARQALTGPRARRRHRVEVAFVALVAVTLLLLGGIERRWEWDGWPRGAPADPVLTPTCRPVADPPTVTVDQVNAVVAGANLPGWQAGDIGATARLGDGRLVWVFGDTVRSAGTEPRIVANSMLVSSALCVSQLVTDGRGPVVPDEEDGDVHWPMSVVAYPAGKDALDGAGGDTVVVLTARTRRGAGGPFDFEYVGSSAAVFQVAPGGVPRLVEVLELTADDPDPTRVNWGAAATVDGSWLYVYGTRQTGDPLVFGRELFVGRAPLATSRNRGTWRFWDGARWQRDQERATPVLEAEGGVSQTLSVSVLGAEFVAVSKRDGDLGDFVYVWTAASPVGPWTPRRGVSAPASVGTDELEYAPLGHPEVRLASGGLLVSISRNTTDLRRLLSRPSVGRPRFVELPWPGAADPVR